MAAALAAAGLVEELTRHEACREAVAKARSGGASALKVLLALAVGDAAGPRVQAAGALRNVAADPAVGARAADVQLCSCLRAITQRWDAGRGAAAWPACPEAASGGPCCCGCRCGRRC
jgi:hypothetical protein